LRNQIVGGTPFLVFVIDNGDDVKNIPNVADGDLSEGQNAGGIEEQRDLQFQDRSRLLRWGWIIPGSLHFYTILLGLGKPINKPGSMLLSIPLSLPLWLSLSFPLSITQTPKKN